MRNRLEAAAKRAYLWAYLLVCLAAVNDLQIVIAGKAVDIVPRMRETLLQRAAHHYRVDVVVNHGKAPGRIRQVVAWLGCFWAKLADYTRQAVGPVAGAKCAACTGDALNQNFLCGIKRHGC